MRELALFAGAGGGILGGRLLGWRTICAVECDAYAASVLVTRQNDGSLAPFPVWDDVRTFDGTDWTGRVDVISGGFPCQDISAAGAGKGIDGERSGLWREFARIICEVRPRYVFVENSPMLTARGLGVVLGDLAALGYDARWDVFGAAHVGAPHLRRRIWIVAHACSEQLREQQQRSPRGRIDVQAGGQAVSNGNGAQEPVANTEGVQPIALGQRGGGGADAVTSSALGNSDGVRQLQQEGRESAERRRPSDSSWWATEPDVGRMAHGVASRVDRLKAIGNGQVPSVAALAWEALRP